MVGGSYLSSYLSSSSSATAATIAITTALLYLPAVDAAATIFSQPFYPAPSPWLQLTPHLDQLLPTLFDFHWLF